MTVKERNVKWMVILFRKDFEIESATYYIREQVDTAVNTLKRFLPKNQDYTIIVESTVTETHEQEKYYIQ